MTTLKIQNVGPLQSVFYIRVSSMSLNTNLNTRMLGEMI